MRRFEVFAAFFESGAPRSLRLPDMTSMRRPHSAFGCACERPLPCSCMRLLVLVVIIASLSGEALLVHARVIVNVSAPTIRIGSVLPNVAFPSDLVPGYETFEAGLRAAVDFVNANSSILPNHTLELRLTRTSRFRVGTSAQFRQESIFGLLNLVSFLWILDLRPSTFGFERHSLFPFFCFPFSYIHEFGFLRRLTSPTTCATLWLALWACFAMTWGFLLVPSPQNWSSTYGALTSTMWRSQAGRAIPFSRGRRRLS